MMGATRNPSVSIDIVGRFFYKCPGIVAFKHWQHVLPYTIGTLPELEMAGFTYEK